MEFLRKLLRNPLVGVVDAHHGRTIKGWARNTRVDQPVTVDFYLDGKIAGSTVADLFRTDLRSQTPHGRCAFEYSLPEIYCDDSEHTIEVRARGRASPLTNGRFNLRLRSAQFYHDLLCELLRSGLWMFAGVIANGTALISGWYISPDGEDGHVTVNGQPIALQIRNEPGEWKSPLPPQFAVRTFHGNVPLPLDRRIAELHFSFGSERPFRPLHDYYYPLFDIVMPEPERRVRVAGHESKFVFNLEGYSIAKKLDVLSERFSGRRLAAQGPVLDWGCGCGRVAGFLVRDGADLHGIDIDKDNVRWCADHIAARFATIGPKPPTAFADDFFGAIYGISVFTHLTQDYEAMWLAELHRIAKPGALLFFSVLGRVAAAREGLLETVSLDPLGDLLDFGRNPDIDLVTQGSEYYRNTFHNPGYIARVWGEYFEILAIEEGIVGNYQDLVVARKPR